MNSTHHQILIVILLLGLGCDSEAKKDPAVSALADELLRIRLTLERHKAGNKTDLATFEKQVREVSFQYERARRVVGDSSKVPELVVASKALPHLEAARFEWNGLEVMKKPTPKATGDMAALEQKAINHADQERQKCINAAITALSAL